MTSRGILTQPDVREHPGRTVASTPSAANTRQLIGLIRVVKSDAEGAVLVLGLAIVLVAVVRQIGPWKFASGAPFAVTLATGLLLTVGGAVWIIKGRSRIATYLPGTLQGALPEFAYDHEFLLRAIINGMPPVFIKEVTDESSSQHLLQSNALSQLQGLNDAIPVRLEAAIEDARRRAIKSDHRQGDEHAVSRGRSRQVEFLDALAGQPLRAVLTTKTRVDHNGRTFVVGWAIPVALTDGLAGDTTCLSEDSGEVRHRLMPVEADTGVEVEIATAVRTKLAELEAKTRPAPGGVPDVAPSPE